ncbi:MAG: ATP-binding protein, partial [Exilispira sp.]
EVMGKSWFDIFINNNDKENLIEQWNNITGKKLKNHEYMNFILAKNGNKRMISWRNNFIKDKKGNEYVLSIGLDITEKYEAEIKLQENNKKLKMLLEISQSLTESIDINEIFNKIPISISSLMENISSAVYILQKNILYLNSAFPALTENFPDDLKYANLEEHRYIEKALKSKRYIYIEDISKVCLTEKELEIVKIRDLKTILYIPLYYQENIFGVIIIGFQHEKGKFTEEDINFFNTIARFASIKIEELQTQTENQLIIEQLKKANEKQEDLLIRLHQSEEKFKRLFNNALDIIFRYEIKPSPKFSYINEAVNKIAGYKPEEYYIDPDFVFKTVFEKDKNLVYDILKGRKDFGKTYNIRFITKNNQIIYLDLKFVPIYDEKGDLIAIEGIARDITEKIKSEEEKQKLHEHILQIQKIESIGMLAGGVAHDFNNLIAIILGYSEQIKSRLVEIGESDYEINQIINAAQNSKDIIKQLLAFGRRQTLELRVVNLNNIIKSMEDMIKKTIREDIELQIILSSNLDNILADPVQIQQIIINLVANSRDALINGGKIIIETSIVEFDDKYTATHVGTIKGKHVMLAISDNGAGMDKETLNRIFEPFFTTKEKGKGSGLGLATVYGIVKQLEGNIFVYSEIGKGTTFKVYFPSSNKKEEISSMNEDKSENVRASGEKILLVEDDENLRRVTKLMLEKLNYNVTVAKSPFEALSIIERNGNLFDCILTDVIMPEMNGRQLVDKIKAKYPEIKVLFMSGYTDNVIVHHGILDSGVEYIQKPFMMNEIGEKLKNILKEKDKKNN